MHLKKRLKFASGSSDTHSLNICHFCPLISNFIVLTSVIKILPLCDDVVDEISWYNM